jgi:hypothetical protein
MTTIIHLRLALIALDGYHVNRFICHYDVLKVPVS